MYVCEKLRLEGVKCPCLSENSLCRGCEEKGTLMDFEAFTGKNQQFSKPVITIRKSGSLGVSTSAYEKFFKNKKYVVLMYEKEKKVIGIKPLEEPQENAMRVSGSKKVRSYTIAAASFLRFYGIRFEKNRRFIPQWSEKYKLVAVPLGEEKETKT